MPDTFNYLEITTLDGDRPRGSLHLRRFRSQFIVTARDHTDVAVIHLSYEQAEQLAEVAEAFAFRRRLEDVAEGGRKWK